MRKKITSSEKVKSYLSQISELLSTRRALLVEEIDGGLSIRLERGQYLVVKAEERSES